MTSAPSSDFGAYVHPDEARMAAWRRVYENYLVVADIYPALADRVLAEGAHSFVEVAAGRAPMARILSRTGVECVAVDADDEMLAECHRPAVKADICHLPLPDGCVDAAAAVNCLYFLAAPTDGVREAWRVLRVGGVFVASAPSRWNDPELEGIDPRWGQPSPFDSEDAPDIVSSVFGKVEVETWRQVAYRLPDGAAVAEAELAHLRALMFGRDVRYRVLTPLPSRLERCNMVVGCRVSTRLAVRSRNTDRPATSMSGSELLTRSSSAPFVEGQRGRSPLVRETRPADTYSVGVCRAGGDRHDSDSDYREAP